MCSTGVEWVFSFPAGARAIGRVGGRCTQVKGHRFDAAGVSKYAARREHGSKEASAHCKAMWDGIRAVVPVFTF